MSHDARRMRQTCCGSFTMSLLNRVGDSRSLSSSHRFASRTFTLRRFHRPTTSGTFIACRRVRTPYDDSKYRLLADSWQPCECYGIALNVSDAAHTEAVRCGTAGANSELDSGGSAAVQVNIRVEHVAPLMHSSCVRPASYAISAPHTTPKIT